MCKKTGESVLSSSFNGDAVHLFLLYKGKVIEHMYGNYNSYGQVFQTKLDTSVKHELYKSFEWKMDWGDICELQFSTDKSSGIAAILDIAFDGELPTEKSKDDPNQGWGKHGELMGSTSKKIAKRVKNPFHKIIEEIEVDEILNVVKASLEAPIHDLEGLNNLMKELKKLQKELEAKK